MPIPSPGHNISWPVHIPSKLSLSSPVQHTAGRSEAFHLPGVQVSEPPDRMPWHIHSPAARKLPTPKQSARSPSSRSDVAHAQGLTLPVNRLLPALACFDPLPTILTR